CTLRTNRYWPPHPAFLDVPMADIDGLSFLCIPVTTQPSFCNNVLQVIDVCYVVDGRHALMVTDWADASPHLRVEALTSSSPSTPESRSSTRSPPADNPPSYGSSTRSHRIPPPDDRVPENYGSQAQIQSARAATVPDGLHALLR